MTPVLCPSTPPYNSAVLQPSPPNLAPNGGISQLAYGNTTSGWTSAPGSGTAATYAVNTTNPSYLHGSDASSLEITVSGYGSGDITNPINPANQTYYANGGNAPSNPYAAIPFTVAPGGILRATVYVKSASGSVPVWMFGRDNETNGYRHVGSLIAYAVSLGWTELTITMPGIPGADGTCAPSIFLAVGVGTVYVSSLSVVETAPYWSTNPLVPGPVSNALFGLHVNIDGTTGDLTPTTAPNYPLGTNYPPSSMNYGLQRTHDCAGVDWAYLETGNGTYNSTNLANLDIIMQAAHARGVGIIYTIAYTPSWAGSSFTSPPTDNSYLTSFISFLMTRYSASGTVPCPGTLKFIEIWNEWDQNQPGTNGWSGTVAQMVSLANAVYTSVVANNSSLGTFTQVIAPNVTYEGQGFFETFLTQYAATYGSMPFPWFSYHLYPTNFPEVDIVYATALLSNLANHGATNAQLIMSEGCYYVASPTLDQQRAFSTLPFLMYALFKVYAGFWYMYYISTSNFLTFASVPDSNGNPTTITPAGTAFGIFTEWLVNSTFTGYSVNPDGNWVVGLVLGNGIPAHLAWNTSGTGTLNCPSYWHCSTITDLGGNSTAIAGSQVTLTRSPVLIQ